MNKDELHKAQYIDKNLSPLSTSKKKRSDAERFTATFNPALPSGDKNFTATKFINAELVDGHISVLGSSGTGAKFKQIGFLSRTALQVELTLLVTLSKRPSEQHLLQSKWLDMQKAAL